MGEHEGARVQRPWGPTPCIFCRRTGSPRSREHVVPKSIAGGGWIVTWDVCKRCNNTLGRDVDAVFGDDWAVAFRQEAGIAVTDRIEVDFSDPETGERVRGFRYKDGTLEPRRLVSPVPNWNVAFARTVEVVRAAIEQVAKRWEERGKRVVKDPPRARGTGPHGEAGRLQGWQRAGGAPDSRRS
jgi:hypothetical protein